MTRASVDTVGGIHGAIAETLTDEIKRLRESETSEPKDLAAMLRLAIMFCKDNGITAIPEANKQMQGLAQVLPFPGHVGGEGEDEYDTPQAASN